MEDESNKKPTIIYYRIPGWVRDYGSSGNSDQAAMNDFMICEQPETVKSLQNELISVTNGNYTLAQFEITVGNKRRVRYGSYEEWAKVMLLWMASHRG